MKAAINAFTSIKKRKGNQAVNHGLALLWQSSLRNLIPAYHTSLSDTHAFIVGAEHLGRVRLSKSSGAAHAGQFPHCPQCIVHKRDQPCLIHIEISSDRLKPIIPQIQILPHPRFLSAAFTYFSTVDKIRLIFPCASTSPYPQGRMKWSPLRTSSPFTRPSPSSTEAARKG